MNTRAIGFLLVATVALMIGGIDIYLPTFPYLVKFFNTTPEFIQFTLIISPLVSALVSFIWGRQADIYSHKHLILFALLLFGFGALICAFSECELAFLMGRLVQAIGGSGLSILTTVLLYDLFSDPKEQARYMALYGAMFPAVFALAPMIGAQLFEYCCWQACFIFVTFVSIIFMVLYSIVLKDYCIKQRKETSHTSAFSQINDLIKNKIFVAFVLGHSFPIAISMLFTANSSFVFQNYFCYSPVEYSFVQSIPIAFNFLGSLYYRHLIQKINIMRTIQIAGFSTLCFTIALFFIIFTPVPITPVTLIATMGIFTFYMSFSISSCVTEAIKNRSGDKGGAIAAISACRNFIGSGVVILCGQFLNGTPYPMLYSMFIIGFLLTWILLYMCPQQNKKSIS